MSKANLLPPFKRFCVTIGNLPSSYVDSMSYYECIMWLCKYLKETVVPTVNENAEAVNELIHWFENLDVQDEIDNKLDEMVESGELQEIISEYLNSQAVFGYDTVADMKSATNLINGSFAKTLGFNSLNDGGEATYKIRQRTYEDVVDEKSIILINEDTVAELVLDGVLNIKQFGAVGDNETNNASILQACVNFAISKGLKLYIPDGIYYSDSRITITGTLEIDGSKNAIVSFDSVAECFAPQENSSVTLKGVKIVNNQGISYNLNKPNNVDTLIESNNIDSAGYGVLVNNNTDGGKCLKVTGNTISAGADAIEINTINTTSTKFQDIIIDNNILSTPLSKNPENPTTAGFAVGIATGKNIVVSNNVIPETRREGIHIESGSEHIAVCNNVIDNCELDGINVYADNTKNTEPHIITNNTIKSNGNNTGTNGIYYTNTAKGQLKQLVIKNNIIDGFTYAINNGGTNDQLINADGLIVRNCGQLINGSAKKIKGSIFLDNTNKIGNFNSGMQNTIIESLSLNTDLHTDWLKVDNNNSVTIKELNYIKPTESASGTRNIPLMLAPSIINNCILTVNIHINNNLRINVSYLVNYDGTDLTATKIKEIGIGAISLGALSISDGYLVVPVYSTNSTTPTLNVSFNGDILFSNYNQ